MYSSPTHTHGTHYFDIYFVGMVSHLPLPFLLSGHLISPGSQPLCHVKADQVRQTGYLYVEATPGGG